MVSWTANPFCFVLMTTDWRLNPGKLGTLTISFMTVFLISYVQDNYSSSSYLLHCVLVNYVLSNCYTDCVISTYDFGHLCSIYR